MRKIRLSLSALDSGRRPTAASPSVRPAGHAALRGDLNPGRDRVSKTQKASCLLTNAPSPAAKAQLDELYLKISPLLRRDPNEVDAAARARIAGYKFI